jgi:hypothetical protein
MSHSIELYEQNAVVQGMVGYGCSGYIQQIPVSRPNARALEIQWLGDGRIALDYGEEIRLLMAEPVKGIKLREAIQLLKEALCHNLDRHQ